MDAKIQKKTPKQWVVVVQYDGPYGDKGTVLSRHDTYELAATKIRRDYPGGFCEIKHVAGCLGIGRCWCQETH